MSSAGPARASAIAPLKLSICNGNTYTPMYRDRYTKRERERAIHTHIHTVTKNRVIYEGQFSVKLIGFHDVTLGITKNR